MAQGERIDRSIDGDAAAGPDDVPGCEGSRYLLSWIPTVYTLNCPQSGVGKAWDARAWSFMV